MPANPLGYEPIYNVTKAALVMFSKCLANELIADNIRVNTVNPGLVMTPDWQKTARLLAEGTAQSWEAYLDNIARENAPIGRFASPEEVANLFVFLCSSPGQLLRRLDLLHRRWLAPCDHIAIGHVPCYPEPAGCGLGV